MPLDQKPARENKSNPKKKKNKNEKPKYKWLVSNDTYLRHNDVYKS